MSILRAEQISRAFGGLRALEDVDLEVRDGEILALIGPNGAGKTTFFNVVTGYLKPTSGRVYFQGREITGLPPHIIAGLGMVRTFQASIMFDKMTVMESMRTAHHLAFKESVLSVLFNLAPYRQRERQIEKESGELLEFMGLEGLKNELVHNLPHGQHRALGVAMALAAKPRFLLLDEPVTGMNPEEMLELMKRIHDLRDQKHIAILIIEHHMGAVMEFSDRIAVLNFGKKIAEGDPSGIGDNRQVIEAYLGKGFAHREHQV